MSSPSPHGRVTRQSAKAAENLLPVNTPSTSRIFYVNDTPTKPIKRTRSTTTTPRGRGSGSRGARGGSTTTPRSSPLKRARVIQQVSSSDEEEYGDDGDDGSPSKAGPSGLEDEGESEPDAEFLSTVTERSSNIKGKNLIFRNSFDAYFLAASKLTKTSSNVFSELVPPLSPEEYTSLLAKSAAGAVHEPELERIWKGHVKLFPRYTLELDEGFNLLFFGFGSKRTLLNEFAKTICSKRGHVVVVNGFMPEVGIRDLVSKIEEIRGVTEVPLVPGLVGLEAQARRIYDFFVPKAVRPKQRVASSAPLFLIIHNIESPSLRTTKAKSILSLLALNPRIHLIASIDHIHSELIWSTLESSTRKHLYTEATDDVPSTRGFAWVWHDMTTMRHYEAELAHLNLGSIRGKSSKTAAADANQEMTELAAKHILLSVNVKAKKLFALLAKTLLAASEEGTASSSKRDKKQFQAHAVSYTTLFNAARADFIATNDTSFKALLAEYRDHGLVLTTVSGGSECLWIPLGAAELKNVLAELSTEQ